MPERQFQFLHFAENFLPNNVMKLAAKALICRTLRRRLIKMVRRRRGPCEDYDSIPRRRFAMSAIRPSARRRFKASLGLTATLHYRRRYERGERGRRR